MSSHILCNSNFMLRAMLERGLSITEASADSGVKRDRLSKLLKNNRPVEIKTASKLAKYFGDDAIIIADAAQERK